MTRKVYVVASILAVAFTAEAQVGRWKNFTSMTEVRAIARAGDTYWVATRGGLFAWNRAESVFNQLTNAEGLLSLDLTAVAVDNRGDVWTGAANGTIHVYSPESKTWRYIHDIANANQTNKRINALVVHGDTLLICTEFGVSVFKIGKFEFGDTFTRFGNFPESVKVRIKSAAIHGGRIWVAATDGGSMHRVGFASLSNPNLLPPEAWTLQTVGDSIPQAVVIFNDRVYVGTTGGAFYLDMELWSPIPSLAGVVVRGMSASNEALALCTASQQVFTVTASHAVSEFGTVLPSPPTSIVSSPTGEPVVGSNNGALTFNSQWISNKPNGPASNQFTSIAVDPAGNVWAASGEANGRGIFRFDGNEWRSFTSAEHGLPTDNYFRVSVGCDGSAWASSWGGGLVEFPGGTGSVDTSHVYGTNVGLVGIPADPIFIVASSVECDSRGNTWMSIYNAADGNILAIRKADGTWTRIPARISGSALSALFWTNVDRSLAVDAFDNIWAVVRDGAYRGVISLGNRGTIDGTVAFHLTTQDGLPNDEVTTIVADRDNDIWIGTERGIAIVLDPSNPKRSGGIAAYRPLNGLTINTIAVDPINQKWVGTTDGVIVLSPDGTQQIASYTVASTNGKLISNDVKSIAVDGKTGTVYFGTLNGLASLTTAAASPKASFDELFVSPNPYVIPNPAPLTVDGLVANSSLKILSIDGKLVRQIRTPGGRLGFWDGTDEQGAPVSSGIYVIVAFSDDGNNVATGKVAIVRR